MKDKFKNIRRQKLLILIPSLSLLALFKARYGFAQDGNWQDVVKSLVLQRDSIKSIQAQLLLEVHVNNSIKADYEKSARVAFKGVVADWNLTPERVYSYNWAARGTQWRCERTQFYPPKPTAFRHAHDFAINDGEKLFRYDDDLETGYIDNVANDNRHQDVFFLGQVNENRYLPFGLIDDIEMASKITDFHSIGQKVVNGETCQGYTGTAVGEVSMSRLTVWVAPDKGLSLVKTIEETVGLDNAKKPAGFGDEVIYSLTDLSQNDQGIYLPKQVKREAYDIKDNALQWQGTDVLTINSAQINGELDDSTFKADFPPGISLVDSSGQGPVMLGPNPHTAIKNVMEHSVPTRELTDGSAPTVVSPLLQK